MTLYSTAFDDDGVSKYCESELADKRLSVAHTESVGQDEGYLQSHTLFHPPLHYIRATCTISTSVFLFYTITRDK